jgi:hypothetical protein
LRRSLRKNHQLAEPTSSLNLNGNSQIQKGRKSDQQEDNRVSRNIVINKDSRNINPIINREQQRYRD